MRAAYLPHALWRPVLLVEVAKTIGHADMVRLRSIIPRSGERLRQLRR